MSLSNTNPLYSQFLDKWKLSRDCYSGEDSVKEKGVVYLPATSGQVADGMKSSTDAGQTSYNAYRARAVFHEFLKEAVETYIGVMWSKPPVIELPAKLEGMLTQATTKGESLQQLLRRINEEQLVTGRLGLLLDLPTTPQKIGTLPYIAMYPAESIINWDDGERDEVSSDSLNLVVLEESEYERQVDFSWEWEVKYRVLTLGDTLENEEKGVYKVGSFIGEDSEFNEAAMQVPIINGGSIKNIPFTFINSKDIVAEPDTPPLLGLAKLSLAIYRGEADYRQSLHLQGQDTLVVIGVSGENESFRVGAGSALTLPPNSDAKFIGVDSSGLEEQRMCLENDKQQASSKAGQLVDTRSKEKESGEALTKRINAQTATLNQIALSGAGGLEKILKSAAEWVGANPDEVKITPNLDFANQEMNPKDLVDMMAAKTLGAPLSKRSIHHTLKSRGVTEMEYEDELAEIETEAPDELEGTQEGGDS